MVFTVYANTEDGTKKSNKKIIDLRTVFIRIIVAQKSTLKIHTADLSH